ncbi:lipid-binding SYLF domain-containing protein [Roseomonas sp. NAR14]|uniref:Lipid-binding SYLF domain-containing protein n=1 Tax=Roseomonas acroporae TaxID=2937791 RepID=A0A9X2BYB9_9PROT|nr:lipid-binding SYLF domain-containing protein [Roseomonas acroporae]MCK8786809.1 lipid-binding SYLF domain-containing protein [Roseomonas acroporae]
MVLAFGCALSGPALAQGEQQALVDRATLAVQEMLGYGNDAANAADTLRRARAVMVCPRIFRAGFIFGGEGGDCALLARDANGSWSSPAFYTMGSASIGLTAGIQEMELMMLIMTERGLRAVMDSQFKIGGDASIAVATLGGSVQGATTAAIGADILAYARSRGLFASLSLSGSILSSRSSWNRAYYGKEVGPQQIVIGMEAHNPGADPLRAVLTRYGSRQAAAEARPLLPPPVAGGAPGGYGAGPAYGGAAPGGTVSRESLPPPR